MTIKQIIGTLLLILKTIQKQHIFKILITGKETKYYKLDTIIRRVKTIC